MWPVGHIKIVTTTFFSDTLNKAMSVGILSNNVLLIIGNAIPVTATFPAQS